jgi:tetratricopeptide (TPR) repeat protein
MHDPHFARAQLLYESHRYEQALEEIQYYLASAPDAAEGHCLAAWCLWRLKRFPEATERAREAIASEPEWAQPYCLLARILKERNRLPEAQAAIEQALRLDPDEPSQYVVQAIIQVRQGKFADAVQTAENGLEIDPTHDDCRSVRALALSLLGRNEEALASSKEVLADDPEGPFTHASRGWVLLRAYQPQRAQEHFLEALRMMPDYEWAREGLVLATTQRRWIYRSYAYFQNRIDRLPRYLRLTLLSFLGMPAAVGVLAASIQMPKTTAAVLGFAIWIAWTWHPISLLLLRLNRFGRAILSHNESRIADSCGIASIAGWSGIFVGLFSNRLDVALVSGALLFLIRPLTDVARCDAGMPRNVLISYLLFLFGLVACLVVCHHIGPAAGPWARRIAMLNAIAITTLPFVSKELVSMRIVR